MNHYWTFSYQSGKYTGLSANGKTKEQARKNLAAKVKRRKAAEMQLSYEQWDSIYGIVDMMYDAADDRECYFYDNQWGISNQAQLDDLMVKIKYHASKAKKKK